jgi:hypothetical protein
VYVVPLVKLALVENWSSYWTVGEYGAVELEVK